VKPGAKHSDFLALTLPEEGYQPAPANAPGESWRDLRSAGQTIAECADILGVSFSTVARTVSGRSANRRAR